MFTGCGEYATRQKTDDFLEIHPKMILQGSKHLMLEIVE